jgi:hypothetical protein
MNSQGWVCPMLTKLHEIVATLLAIFISIAALQQSHTKIKSFRAELRGVPDIPFFLFRLSKLYA